MNTLLANKLDELKTLCQKHRVQALYVFGSVTREDFDAESSDLDFLVEFQPQKRRGFNDVYFKLLEDLRNLFEREVDLVERPAIEQSRNYIRRRNILNSARILYAA